MMRESQFIYDLLTRLNIMLCAAARELRLMTSRDNYIKPSIADIYVTWHAKRKSSPKWKWWKFRWGEKENEFGIEPRFRHPRPYLRLTSLTSVPPPSSSPPLSPRSSERVGMCACFGSPRNSADLTLNRMISSGRQSGRRHDTSHRRAGRDRRRMEIGEPERRSQAAADPGPGAAARRQSRRGRGRPGNVVLRARRSARVVL